MKIAVLEIAMAKHHTVKMSFILFIKLIFIQLSRKRLHVTVFEMTGKDLGAKHVRIINCKGLVATIVVGPGYDIIRFWITHNSVQLLDKFLRIHQFSFRLRIFCLV